tara:strand:+ start:4076 stop:4504 length:429 start_codon:yes stop_codon:yes gene_type:complete
MEIVQQAVGVTGRCLLGLYFLIPGITKVTGFGANAAYMEKHGMVFVPFFLIVTLILQIGGGLFLIVGFQVRITALMFALMILAINIVMHDFWNVYEGLSQAHETQNFVKNLAIMAGLLVLGAHQGESPLSADQRLKRPPFNA